MIHLSNIHKKYQMGDVVVHALRGVSLAIEAGEFVAIMGPSGSGKSTLMHILGLLDVPDAGSYKLSGKEVSKLNQDELASLRGLAVGFVFQQFNLLARTTALDNVALPLHYSGGNSVTSRPRQLLESVGLGSRLTHKPNELSGGQQQRVAIARALVNDPSILFADEPTGNLDSASQTEIMEIFKRLNEQGKTIILVTHEEEIAAYARRIIRMRDGKIVGDEIVKKVSSKTIPSPLVGEGEDGGSLIERHPPPLSSPRKGEEVTLAKTLGDLASYFAQAWRALSANKVRSGLSMLGITIGVTAVIAMLALGRGAKQAIETQLSALGSNLLVLFPGARRSFGVALEQGAVTRFTLEDARDIAETIPSVQKTSPSVLGRGQVVYGGKNWNTQVIGAAPDYAPMRSYVPVVGRFFTEEENRRRARVAVLGMTVIRQLFGDVSSIGEFIKINKISFQVVGILPEKGSSGWRDQDDLIIIPIQTAMRRLLGKTYVDTIDIQVESPQAMEATEKSVQDLIIRHHHLPPSLYESFQIRNMADIQAALSESSRTMSWLLASIAAISLLVGGIGIMNIMLVSVTERTHEIGLRKAVGARGRDILAQFLIEALTTSLVGGLAGIALGTSITLSLSWLAHWTASVTWDSALMASLFSAGIGVVFGLWPARKAAQLNPIDALRYE